MVDNSEKQLTWEEEMEAYYKGIEEARRYEVEQKKNWTPEQWAVEKKRQEYREERDRYWKLVEELEKKYIVAELGERIPRCYLDDAPREVMDYPGGIVGVYEEAMRRGIPWEKVCGYKPLDPSWFKQAFLD